MMDFRDVIDFLNSVADPEENNRLIKFNPEEINRLREEYRDLPDEYSDYLLQVGSGSLNRCRYIIYGDLLKPSNIFNIEDIERLENHILLFGDDFTGNPAGFLVTKDWRIAEILHENLTLNEVNLSFGQFIRQRMGMMDD